jgi:hypothetical protein
MSETPQDSVDTYIQPEIEGVRVVGFIEPADIAATPGTPKPELVVTGNDVLPDEFMLVEQIRQNLDADPSDTQHINITKLPYDETVDDPFAADALSKSMGNDVETPEDPVHKDLESRLIRVVSNEAPTVFYPKDENGNADMSRGWQANPGEIVEFTGDVWHSPQLQIAGSGERTLVTLRVGYPEPAQSP